MDLLIEPVVFPKMATRIKIDVSVLLGKKAIVRVSFYERDSEYSPLDTQVFYIENQEYEMWGQQDSYLEELIFKKLGISKPVEKPKEEIQQENIIIDA